MPRLAALVAVIVTAAVASAQPQPAAVQRPSFSPYLNLARGGTNPGINYLGVVRPQMQLQQQYGLLQQQLRQTNQSLQEVGSAVYGTDPNVPLSGHAAVFNNTGRYFSSNPAFGSMVGGGVGTGRLGSALTVQPPRPGMGPMGGGSRPSMGAGFGGRR